VRKAKEALGHLHKIEVRVANERELRDALKLEADVVLFEDLEVAELTRLVALARELSSIVKVEYSGNITLENVRTFAEAGADMISIAALTNSARAMNVGFKCSRSRNTIQICPFGARAVPTANTAACGQTTTFYQSGYL
jgi:nicotinate-nucleotide pyrophosphorylase (carboxylating)